MPEARNYVPNDQNGSGKMGVGLMAKKPGRRGSADPMVPVYGPNLRAAMLNQGLRVADVARDLKINRQTIAYLAAGEGTKRSRASRRARLAKLLKVTEQWLGEPSTAFIPLLAWNIPGGIATMPEAGFYIPPRVQLAMRRFLEKAVAAATRDLSNKALRDGRIKETESIDNVLRHVAVCVRTLVDVHGARNTLLVGMDGPSWGIMFNGEFLRSRHLPADTDEEEAAIDLIGAWEQILEPWFSGEATMNYRRLRERAGFPVPDGERRSDTNPYIIVWQPEKGAP